MTKPRRYRINNNIVVRLIRALEAARFENYGAAVDPDMRSYINAWVEAPLRSALKEITGEEQR